MVIGGNRLADCTEKVCANEGTPYCFKAKTNLDNLVKDKLYGPKSSTGGRIDDIRVNTGIKGFDKIDIQTGYYSSPDKQSSLLGARAKFFDYFAFAGVTG